MFKGTVPCSVTRVSVLALAFWLSFHMREGFTHTFEDLVFCQNLTSLNSTHPDSFSPESLTRQI